MTINIPAFKTAIRLLREWDRKTEQQKSEFKLDMRDYGYDIYGQSCKTVCCGLGYLGLHPIMQKRFGLVYKKGESKYGDFYYNGKPIVGHDIAIKVFGGAGLLYEDDIYTKCFYDTLPFTRPSHIADAMLEFMKEHTT